MKRGQIAHLDHNANNNEPGNLAFLCLDHHELYDSTTSQSKGLTIGEVKVYRSELEEALATAFSHPITLTRGIGDSETWEGVYRWEHDNASAEIQIARRGPEQYSVSGMAFWGTTDPLGPHIGELEAEAVVWDAHLVVLQNGYRLMLIRTPGGLAAEEDGHSGGFGINVSFAGLFSKVPQRAEVLPQPPLRTFESEFWPEEGRPLFIARRSTLTLHARPSSDAPVLGLLPVSHGSRVEFAGFRYRTLRPGKIVALADGELSGRNLGPKDSVSRANYYEDGGEVVTIHYKRGDFLEYLQYRAEGTGFIRFQGLVIDTDLPWLALPSELHLLDDPIAERWIQIENRGFNASGWILADEELDEVGRVF